MAFTRTTSVESLRRSIAAFARARDWDRFHSVRNVLLALVSEVGELCEVVRWNGEGDPIPKSECQAWADEIGDVAILLIRLADVSGVDLPKATAAKLAKAAKKYPVHAFKGSNRKYDRPAPEDAKTAAKKKPAKPAKTTATPKTTRRRLRPRPRASAV